MASPGWLMLHAYVNVVLLLSSSCWYDPVESHEYIAVVLSISTSNHTHEKTGAFASITQPSPIPPLAAIPLT